MTDARKIVKPTEPWRQRLIRSLLYGRNVDRAAKARARVGLAMIAFAGVYGIIAVRLVMFPIIGDTHGERRATRDAIANLRAEWAKLDAPLRLQGLAERHLNLKPITAQQFDQLKNLPDRPPSFAKPGDPDPIGAMIDTIDPDIVTGSLPAPEDPQ